jgi:hypothetical protein
MAVGTVGGTMVAGTVEGIMGVVIMVEDIMVEVIMAAGIMVAGIMVEGIMPAGIMPDVVAITEAMPTLTPPMPCMVARLTTVQRTIIGMDATPSALTLLGTIGDTIGITGAGAGPISGAMR